MFRHPMEQTIFSLRGHLVMLGVSPFIWMPLHRDHTHADEGVEVAAIEVPVVVGGEAGVGPMDPAAVAGSGAGAPAPGSEDRAPPPAAAADPAPGGRPDPLTSILRLD
eukprot:668540-Hanusia_phi.AAC.2